MQKIKELKDQLVLTKEDYEMIIANLRNTAGKFSFNRQDAEDLEGELKKARLVEKDQLPMDAVGLNSKVIIRDEKDRKQMELIIVLPSRADIRQRKISVLSPMGTALIGYRKGKKISWNVPAGRKTFTIVDVQNSFQTQ